MSSGKGNTYTDAQLLIGTQIAYIDVDSIDGYEDMSVGELLSIIENQYERRNDLSKAEQQDLETIQNIRNIMNENNMDERMLNNWRIAGVHNDNDGTGMYGCVIDTGDGSAIVGFRGSESYDMAQVEKDWIIADVGLLNNELTTQQAETEKFMREVAEGRYGDYDRLSFTGHSLGGNLAEHAAVTAPEELQKKLERAVSYDGPGYSQEYIDAHREQIDRVSDKITKYQWSWVGGIMTPLPGSEYVHAKARTPDGGSSTVVNLLFKHATGNLEFDENGNVARGEMGLFETFVCTITRMVESDHPIVAAAGVVMFLSVLPALLAEVIGGKIIDFVKAKIEDIVQMAKEAYEGIKEKVTGFFDMLREEIEREYEFKRRLFGRDVRGEFEVDPAVLRRGAEAFMFAGEDILRSGRRVKEIKNEIPFSSPSISYLKVKLWGIGNSIDRDGKKAEKLGNVLTEVCQIYEGGDSEAAQCYA